MNSSWAQLLKDHNIPIEFDEEESIVPYTPESIESSDSLRVLGAWHKLEPEYISGFNETHTYSIVRKRPIHRYCRLTRFAFVVAQLLGVSGKVPPIVCDIVRLAFDMESSPIPPNKVWNFVRARLKQYKWRLYYNRIPLLLSHPSIHAQLPWLPPTQFTTISRKHCDLLDSFTELHNAFNRIRHTLGRSYFPNLRYVALRLMERHGLLPPYHIPIARTFRKRKSLGILYGILVDEVSLFNKTLS